MILYRHFGGKLAVEAMTWHEAKIALQLLTEDRIGTRVREEVAREDAAVAAALREVGA